MKNLKDLIGIEPLTIRLLAQCLNQLRYSYPIQMEDFIKKNFRDCKKCPALCWKLRLAKWVHKKRSYRIEKRAKETGGGVAERNNDSYSVLRLLLNKVSAH